MSIPKGVRTNFDTLLKAACNGDLALMACTDAKTGEPRYVICAANAESDGGTAFVPFGHKHAEGNPYDAYIPPATE